MRDPWIRLVAMEDACPTLISGKGGKWLVDPGSARGWAYTLRPFLAWHGINSLDGVVLTAGISDRMGAAKELVQAMPVKWWAETGTAIRSPALKEWLAELERREEGKQFWREGEERNLGRDWKARVLWPPAGGGQGKFFAIECKAGDNKPTALQHKEIDSIRRARGLALVVNETNIEEIPKINCLLAAKPLL